VNLDAHPAADLVRAADLAAELAATAIDVAQLVGGRPRSRKSSARRTGIAFLPSRHTHVLKPVDFGPVCA
jgi:hypothetical protein